MSSLASPRYGVAPAPGRLALVQELLNTASAGNTQLPDLLGTPELAAAWIRGVRASFGDERETVLVSPADLERLRSLREAITASVTGSTSKTTRATLTLALGPDGRVETAEPDRPVAWVSSAVLLETLLAQQSGDWLRLKICANPDCHVSFYDRSKNRSGVWHDVHVCGNAVNLRASRSRRRAATQSGAKTFVAGTRHDQTSPLAIRLRAASTIDSSA